MSLYGEQEAWLDCPFCGERISMLLDLSAGGQSYIEDCEVCCRPIRVRYGVRTGEDGLPELSFVEGEAAA
jgi:hypothetical protein